MKSRPILVLALCFIALATVATGTAHAQIGSYNSTNTGNGVQSTPQPQGSAFSSGNIVVQGYISKSTGTDDIPGQLIPVPGATVYFIRNNAIVANATTNPVGFYAVTLPPADGYMVAVSASGFQTVIRQYDIRNTQDLSLGLTQIPFNGFVPYALYPVLETSPGREVDCTIIVQNFQIIDQMVTFTAVTDGNMQAWFPRGESMMVRTGQQDEMHFTLRYTGTELGPQVIKVVVNGGAYFAEIPVIVIVKDLPFEEINFWAYAPEKVVKPGDTVCFTINAENLYARDKDLYMIADKPAGWTISTGNGTELYVPDGKTGSSNLWIYVPSDTRPGNYTMNLTVYGQDVKSNAVKLKIRVDGTPMFDAIIKGKNRTLEGYPIFNLTAGQKFGMTVRIYNSWDFPMSIQATAAVGENWYSYIDGVPNGHVYVEPGKAEEFTVWSRVPNETYGNFTARIYLESAGQTMTLPAVIVIPAHPATPEAAPGEKQGWEGLALTAATATTFLLAMAASVVRRLK